MEHIVSGIAKINFQQNCEDILLENRVEKMSWPAARLANNSEEVDSATDTGTLCADVEEASCSGGGIAARLERRNLPQRACKENKEHKVKRRSIMKPKRNVATISGDFSLLRPADIKKIYTNQKLTKFRPTNLETIFEEPQAPRRGSNGAEPAADDNQLRYIGLRKIRRSLSCSDGLNTDKALTRQRRARIKKIFGRRSVQKKISLTDFLERLNKSLSADEQVYDNTDSSVSTSNDNRLIPEGEPMEADAATEQQTLQMSSSIGCSFGQSRELPMQASDNAIQDVYKSKLYNEDCFATNTTSAAS